MKLSEIKEKSSEELTSIMLENRAKIRQERFGNSSGKSKNVKSTRNLKKEIARILTIIHERELHGKK